MSKEKYRINAEFEQIRQTLENKHFCFNPKATPLIRENEIDVLPLVISRIYDIIHRYKTFFDQYDYAWALDPSSYSCALEAIYQSYVMETLAEITPDHSKSSRFSNIAVRFLASGIASAESIQHKDCRYIILSTSFMKILQECLWLLWRLSSLGKTLTRTKCIVNTTYVGGKYVEAALRTDSNEVTSSIDRFVHVIMSYVSYELPRANPIALLQHLHPGESTGYSILSLYETVEMFMLYHELAHVLVHDSKESQRSMHEELEADFAASSLFMNHNARNLRNMYGPLVGPALFFQIMRSLVLIRRTMIAFKEKDIPRATEDIASEIELKMRLVAYDFYNKHWGVVNKNDQVFWNIVTELHLIIAGCQRRMLQQLGSSLVPSLDELMKPC